MKPIPQNKLLIGLTGPIGSGKSKVAAIWKEMGAGVVSGDDAGKRALSISGLLRRKLAERFGEDIIDKYGFVDREKLAAAAFLSPDTARELTTLTFPALDRIARAEMQRLALLYDVIVYDAALIYEWGIEQDFDKIVVVTALKKTLVQRAMENLGITEDAVKARLAVQMGLTEKKKRGDFVIVNDGDVDELRENAIKVWSKMMESLK